MTIFELEQQLNELLAISNSNDYCPNGLQVEGKIAVNKIITGVTASQELIQAAIEQNADTLLVHHGYFWKSENPVICGMKAQRIRLLMKHDINLLAYHLPLDVHPHLGNNAQLAQRLGFDVNGVLDGQSLVWSGQVKQPMTAGQLAQQITQQLARTPLHLAPAQDKPIKRVAWCTGGGQDYIELAAQKGMDAFISGEVSERTTHLARELGIHYFAAGHHATERYGVQALGEHIAQYYGLSVKFVDIDNPV